MVYLNSVFFTAVYVLLIGIMLKNVLWKLLEHPLKFMTSLCFWNIISNYPSFLITFQTDFFLFSFFPLFLFLVIDI